MDTKLKLLALHKYLENEGYILLDAMCSRSFDYVAVDSDGTLVFVYADIIDYLYPSSQIFSEIEVWFNENPAYKIEYRYEVYSVYLISDHSASIKKIEL